MPGVNRELKLFVEPEPSRVDLMTAWIPRIGVALLFLSVGASKFRSGTMWVPLFAQIGAGQWLRYATGALQIGGAGLLLVPRTTVIGASLLAATMLGAVLVQLFILHTGVMALVPAALLVIVAVVGSWRWL